MRSLLFACLFITCSSAVMAQKDSINIYLNFQDIWGLDLKSGSFNANFYTMMESKLDTMPRLYYLNGKVENLYTSTAPNYSEAWNQGEFRTNINFRNYPLDKQYLEISIEPELNYDKEVLFSHPQENILIGREHLVGWKINRITATSSPHHYKYFNSYVHREESEYSRIIFTIEIERTRKWIFLLKLFFPSFISMLILMIGFLLPPGNIETRYGLGIASIFGVISSLILIQQNLPELAGISLIEILNYIAIITVFGTLVVFAVSYSRHKREADPRKMEWIAFVSLITFYIIATLITLILRS